MAVAVDCWVSSPASSLLRQTMSSTAIFTSSSSSHNSSSTFKSYNKPQPRSRFPTTNLSLLRPKKAAATTIACLGNRAMRPNNIVELINLLPVRNNNNKASRVLKQQQEEEEEDQCIDASSNLVPGSVDNGFESRLNKSSKWIISGLFAVVILCRHDAQAMWAAIGSVANSGLSVVLKKILNQERPVPSLRSEPGMPSSHSQSISYVILFAILSVVEWSGINWITMIICGFALAFGAYLSWLRVSQRLHTMSQVVVGASVGTSVCILWYWSWNAVVHQAFKSSLWVRIVVASGAVGFSIGFIVHVIRHWIKDERVTV